VAIKSPKAEDALSLRFFFFVFIPKALEAVLSYLFLFM